MAVKPQLLFANWREDDLATGALVQFISDGIIEYNKLSYVIVWYSIV